MGALDGRIAIVTGASRGIGAAIAERLAADGAQVILTARDSQALQEVAGRIPGAQWQVMDVAGGDHVDRVISQTAHTLGRLDIVINNAGVIHRGAFLDLSDEQWLETFAVNLTGTFRVMRAAIPHMKQGGRIVNISSVTGIFGAPEAVAYSASKHGVLGLTRTAALELAPKGITVNAVCPGWTDTDMTTAGIQVLAESWGVSVEEAQARIIREMMPIGRLLQPSEIASAVAWLCSDGAAGVTAQAIRVDGGQTPY